MMSVCCFSNCILVSVSSSISVTVCQFSLHHQRSIHWTADLSHLPSCFYCFPPSLFVSLLLRSFAVDLFSRSCCPRVPVAFPLSFPKSEFWLLDSGFLFLCLSVVFIYICKFSLRSFYHWQIWANVDILN